VARLEAAHAPRWVWASSARVYPRLLAAGVRVARCHDLELTEGILLAFDGRFGEPISVPAALARLHGLPAPTEDPADTQPTLFGPPPETALTDLLTLHAHHHSRLTPTHPPLTPDTANNSTEPREDVAASGSAVGWGGRLRLLGAAESAGGLVAAEMSAAGVPWRVDVHDELLSGLLGARPGPGMRPKVLQGLADRISEAFGVHVNPDSPQQLVKAFTGAGHAVGSTRAWVLKGVEHPAVPFVLEYKELSRLYTAHGWSWLDTWVKGGRFRPEYVVGGVVSGRWATRGGGALQIPKVLRRAVIADPGWTLVVADAAQLEPRVLAALAGDSAFAKAA
ncbi:bifunctional 3'-5' exonuclease/DNA polymerase, partial [Actinocorallia lasiicapitis]